VIDAVLGYKNVHHAERERGVRPREERDVLMAFLRRLAAVGIDGDQSCAAAPSPPVRASRSAD
jgi:hypothetical protein